MKNVIFVSLIVSISGILFGYDTGVISGALIFLKKDFIISSTQEGLIVSLLLFGGAIGALVVGKVSDKIGRKNTLLIMCLLYIVGTIGLAQSRSLYEIYVFRFILGLPIGIASFSAPHYIAEISPKHLRGRLVSLFQLAIVVGILLTYAVNYYLSYSGSAWREMFLLGIFPAIILLLGLFIVPESPRWLIKVGKEQEAIKVLSYLRKGNYLDELLEIKATLDLENANYLKQTTLFNKTHFPVITIAFLLMLFQQLSGIDAIIYYAPQIFMHIGLGVHNSFFSTLLIGVVNLISTVIGLLILDKIGRRNLMTYGSFFMAFALLIVALLINNYNFVYLTIAAILLYICAFAVSTGVCGWLIISEIFPLNIRGQGTAMAVTFFWSFNILVSFLFPNLIKLVSVNYIFGFFSVICILSLIYCWGYLPETKGVSLEVIEKNLIKGVKTRYLAQTS